MIKHIVFFNLIERADGKDKAEHALIIKKELENLIHLIPQLKKIEVGLNHPETSSDNFDLSLYAEFDNLADLEVYQKHPEHLRVAAYIGKVKKERACVDYEI